MSIVTPVKSSCLGFCHRELFSHGNALNLLRPSSFCKTAALKQRVFKMEVKCLLPHRVIKGKPKGAVYPFLLLTLYFFLNPSQHKSGRMDGHSFPSIRMSNKYVILKNPICKSEWDIFERQKNEFCSDKDTSLKSPVLFLSVRSAEETLSYTILVSFQVKTSLVCSAMWVNKENLLLDSRLGWMVDKSRVSD